MGKGSISDFIKTIDLNGQRFDFPVCDGNLKHRTLTGGLLTIISVIMFFAYSTNAIVKFV